MISLAEIKTQLLDDPEVAAAYAEADAEYCIVEDEIRARIKAAAEATSAAPPPPTTPESTADIPPVAPAAPASAS